MRKMRIGSGVRLDDDDDSGPKVTVETPPPRMRALVAKIAEREIWYRRCAPDVPERDRYIILSIKIRRVWCTPLGVDVPILGMGHIASMPDAKGYANLRFRLRNLKESLLVLSGKTPMTTINPREIPLLTA